MAAGIEKKEKIALGETMMKGNSCSCTIGRQIKIYYI